MSSREYFRNRTALGSIPQLPSVAGGPLFFDDFEDGTINTAKWLCTGGNIAETGGKLVLTGQSGGNSIKSVMSFSPGTRFEWTGILPTTNQSYVGYGLTIPSVANMHFTARWENSGTLYVNTTADGYIGTGLSTGQHTWRIDWLANGTQQYYVDGVLKHTGSAVTGSAILYFSHYDSGGQLTLDSMTATLL